MNLRSVEGVVHNGAVVSNEKFVKGDLLDYLVKFDENVVKYAKMEIQNTQVNCQMLILLTSASS